jgi:hypothetical protein
MAEAVDFLDLLFVQRHLAKYLRANLDPEKRSVLPNAEVLAHDIALLVPTPWVVGLADAPRAGCARIQLQRQPGDALSPEVHKQIMDIVEEAFREEMYLHAKQLHISMRVPLGDALQSFLSGYGIVEDDLALEIAKRSWRRMATSRGRPKQPPGRPMKPLDALKWPRTRDRLRRMMPGWPPVRVQPTLPSASSGRKVRTGGKRKKDEDNDLQLSFFPRPSE